VVMIYWFRRPRVNLIHHPLTRARALMARPWSARCYGVARQREGSRQNGIGAPRFPFTPASTREGVAGQAVVCPLLRGSSPTRGVAPKQHRGPALTPFITLYAREGADGQAVVCPLLRGSSPTRWVAPKQHRGLCSRRHIR